MKNLSLLAVALLLVGAGCAADSRPAPQGDGGAAGTQLEGTPQVNDTPDARIMAPTRAEDAVYTVDGTPITMRGGVGIVLDAPGSDSKTTTRIFGEPVRTDLDGDGDLDAALLLQSSGSGSGTFYYAAVAIDQDGYFQGSDAVLLGDRIAPQTTEFKDGRLLVNFAERKPGEPMTASPSVGVTKTFMVVDGQLKEVAP